MLTHREARERALDVIVERADHLGRLVEDLLTASTITSTQEPRQAFTSEDGDLESLVNRACNNFPGADERIRVVSPESPISVVCDPTRFIQIMSNLVSNARILGASRLQVVQHVVFPSAMTWIIASLHVALGFAIIGAIVGEFLGAQNGLGLVIATAQNTFDANGVFGAMLVIGVLALGAEGLMSVVERRLLAWKPKSASESNVQGL